MITWQALLLIACVIGPVLVYMATGYFREKRKH